MIKDLMKLSKKGKLMFLLFVLGVMVYSFGIMPVFAEDDPLEVVNNLSDFIFSMIRAIGMILLGFSLKGNKKKVTLIQKK